MYVCLTSAEPISVLLGNGLPLVCRRTTSSRVLYLCLVWLLAWGPFSKCPAQALRWSPHTGVLPLNTVWLEHVHEFDEPHFQGLLIEAASPEKYVKYTIDQRDNKWERVMVLPPAEFAAVFALFSETARSQAHEGRAESATRTGFGSFCLAGRYQPDGTLQEIHAWLAVTDDKTPDFFFMLLSKVNDTRLPLSMEARKYLTSYLLDDVFCVSGTRVPKH